MKQPTVEELHKLRDQLQEEIREARGALKDLRYEIKTARELIPLLTDEAFEAEVKKQVAQFNQVTKKAMDLAVDRVNAKFDRLSDLLMGEDKTSRRRGQASIPELLENPAVVAMARRNAKGKARE